MADKSNEIEISIKVGGQDALVSLEKLRRALKDVDRDSSLDGPRRSMEGLTRTAQYMSREVGTSLRMVMGAGGVGTLGAFAAGGIVAGIVAAGNALSNFSTDALKLHDTAKDLGVTAEALKRFQLAGQAAGMTSQEAASSAENAIRKIQDLQRRGISSDFYKELVKAGGDNTGHLFAKAIIDVAQSKGPEEAMRYLLTRIAGFAKGNNVWAQSTIQNLFGLSGAAAERMVSTLAKLPAIYIPSKEEAANFALQTTVLSAQLDGLKVRFGNALLEPMTKLTGQLNEWLGTDKGKEFQDSIVKVAESLNDVKWGEIADTARATFGTLSFLSSSSLGELNNTMRELRAIYQFYQFVRPIIERAGAAGARGRAFNQLSPDEQRNPDTRGRSSRRWHRSRGQVSGETDSLGMGLPEISIDGVDPSLAFRNRMLRRPRGASDTPYRFTGGGDLEAIEEKQRTGDLIEQMTDVTDEVRRLNDFMFGPAGGGAGGMGPGGGGLGGSLGIGSIGGGGGGDSSNPLGGAGGRGGRGGAGGVSGTINMLKGPDSPESAPTELLKAGLGAGTGSNYLQAERAPLAEAFKERPGLKDALAAVIATEHESDPVAVAESFANRWNMLKQNGVNATPEQMISGVPGVDHGKSFYGPYRSGVMQRELQRLRGQPQRMAKLHGAIDTMLGGSNLIKGATDQGSGSDPNVNWQGGRIVRNREVYNDWMFRGHKPAEQYRLDQQQKVAEGGFNSVAPGRNMTLAEIRNAVGGSEINVANSAPLSNKPPEGAGAVTYSRKTGAVPEELRQKLEYAGLAAGVRTAISSGIEPGHKRHTAEVPAADLDLHDPATGRKLDSTIPADREKMKAYITAARQAGATGIGMGGPGQYMGTSRMHIGESDRAHPAAVWGDKGSGPNTPGWVREAYNEGERSAISPRQRIASIEAMRKQQADSDENHTALAFASGAAIKHITKQKEDAESDRKAINSGLMSSMAKDVVRGKAAVNIDVGAANKAMDDDLKFSKTRSKGGPSMPNTVGNTERDSHAGSSEDGKNDEE